MDSSLGQSSKHLGKEGRPSHLEQSPHKYTQTALFTCSLKMEQTVLPVLQPLFPSDQLSENFCIVSAVLSRGIFKVFIQFDAM